MSRPRVALAIVAVPLAVSQWAPAWAAITTDPGLPSTHRAFYVPLVNWLERAPGPPARVEVVPTADHWEAAYVAPSIALARGWERQLDIADNPIFYTPGALNDASYVNWLEDNGVRYVALPKAPLDFAGAAEARLVRAGVPGLVLVWRSANWQVYRLVDGTGIVTGAAVLTSMEGDSATLDVSRPGDVLVRIRWSEDWHVASGRATVSEAPGGWLAVAATRPGLVRLSISF